MSGRKKDNIISGTPQGGRKAAKTNIERYGEGFYQRIGAIGGNLSKSGGFASQKTSPDGRTGQDRARAAGSIGGKRSKRGHKFIKHENGINYYTCNITGQLRKYREV